MLLYEFSFLPAQVFAMAFAALSCGCSVGAPAVPADFLVKSSFLRYSLFNWVEYGHFDSLPVMSYESDG
jgi:hypothetical protein